jgi:hypothetical protein
MAASVAFLEFPIGLVLAVYTLAVLLGRHHAHLCAIGVDASKSGGKVSRAGSHAWRFGA